MKFGGSGDFHVCDCSEFQVSGFIVSLLIISGRKNLLF
ncbi:Uncharacterized protein dnm_035610 [Desulfonema magnum]|uniref:Uncharacterized protein n=1 Tax=Desulfonema magnum TaxID=45655 RepID=A0A975BLL2_9BACT|nr:Uncharacterized protein dnm_035610 [Desulfonema magnum]